MTQLEHLAEAESHIDVLTTGLSREWIGKLAGRARDGVEVTVWLAAETSMQPTDIQWLTAMGMRVELRAALRGAKAPMVILDRRTIVSSNGRVEDRALVAQLIR